jgi:UTP--glucose-1-phosphate uridylyltransferase
MRIRKAIITAAGWGTRFLPATKTQPKEMLPLVDKPLIHYTVEEIVDSGIDQIVLITSFGKRAIEDYFDRSFELEYVLEKKKDTRLLKQIKSLSGMANICYVRQKEQLGLGHAIFMARDVVGDEPFAVLLPDDIVDSDKPVLKQMLDVYEEHKTSVIAVESIEKKDSPKYGVIEPRQVSRRVHQIVSLVEKPEPDKAPSNLGVVGRYIFTPQIFDSLEITPPGKNGEIQITDAMQLLLKQQVIYAYEFEGTRYDTGTPETWLKATVAYAMKHPDYGQEFRKYLSTIC